MWKKDEAETNTSARPEKTRTPDLDRVAHSQPSGGRATIGQSITIRGEITGDEDLVIQGRVEGSVDLKLHAVEVGPEGKVTADISGRIVTVEGHVEGNLRASERVVLRTTAHVEGDIASPRVTLEDGAYFRGGVEMTDAEDKAKGGGAPRDAANDRSGMASSATKPEASATVESSSSRKRSEKSTAATGSGE